MAFWLYVDAPRWAVAGCVLVPVVGVTVVAGLVAVPFEGDPVETLFQALVGATVTGVTLVVTLNQLVLSQELGAVGDQRERLSAATDFRRDAEALLDGVAPTDPAAFLDDLLAAAAERATRAEAAGGGEAGAAVADLADRVTESTRGVRADLAGAESGTFATTRAALDFDYSRRIDETRRVQAAHDHPAAVAEALDELLDALEFFGVAREHVKTLYFQRALIDLSRTILVAAVPALAVGVGMGLAYRSLGTVSDAVLVGLAVGVTLSPFAVLVASVLRIATVTGRTLAAGPFTLRSTDRDRVE